MSTTETLITKYDQLTKAWQAAEKLIGHVPCPVLLKVNETETADIDGRYVLTEFLGVQRINNTWRLCYGTVRDDYEDIADWKPVVDCTVEVRVQMAHKFKELLAEIEKVRVAFIPLVDIAISALNAVIEVEEAFGG